MTIGNRIELLRSKLSRRDFAKSIGIVENTLRNYEQGLSLPNSDVIAKICTTCGVNIEWLVTGLGPMRPADEGSPSGGVNLRERVQELEKELAEAREAERKALWEAARAYKLATENMRAMTDALQEPPDFPHGGEASAQPAPQKPGSRPASAVKKT